MMADDSAMVRIMTGSRKASELADRDCSTSHVVGVGDLQQHLVQAPGLLAHHDHVHGEQREAARSPSSGGPGRGLPSARAPRCPRPRRASCCPWSRARSRAPRPASRRWRAACPACARSAPSRPWPTRSPTSGQPRTQRSSTKRVSGSCSLLRQEPDQPRHAQQDRPPVVAQHVAQEDHDLRWRTGSALPDCCEDRLEARHDGDQQDHHRQHRDR